MERKREQRRESINERSAKRKDLGISSGEEQKFEEFCDDAPEGGEGESKPERSEGLPRGRGVPSIDEMIHKRKKRTA